MRNGVWLFLMLLLTSASILAKAPTDGIYPDEIEHPVPDDLSKFKQPESLVADLKAIQTGSIDERVKALAAKSLRDQVFVKGGEFQMGDFGPLQSKEKLPWDGNINSKPLHKVTLDSYSLSKYKITFAEFDVYSEANKLPKVMMDEFYTKEIAGHSPYRVPDKAIQVTWANARAYCQWLGTVTHQSSDLPTEAQWEYAARNRGKFIVFPTNNGILDWNVNVPNESFQRTLFKVLGGSYPIAYFPPSPMGLFDMAHNGLEWMSDWYSPTYYRESDGAKNPAGPVDGTDRSVRSWPNGNDGIAKTMSRRIGRIKMSSEAGEPPQVVELGISNMFRCAQSSAIQNVH